MKIIRIKDLMSEKRPDGRDIYNLLSYSSSHNSKIFRVLIPKGTIEKEHMHTNSKEIFLFLKPGEVIIDDKTYSLEKEDILILEPNERHKIIANSEMDLIGIKEDINDKVITEDENN